MCAEEINPTLTIPFNPHSLRKSCVRRCSLKWYKPISISPHTSLVRVEGQHTHATPSAALAYGRKTSLEQDVNKAIPSSRTSLTYFFRGLWSNWVGPQFVGPQFACCVEVWTTSIQMINMLAYQRLYFWSSANPIVWGSGMKSVNWRQVYLGIQIKHRKKMAKSSIAVFLQHVVNRGVNNCHLLWKKPGWKFSRTLVPSMTKTVVFRVFLDSAPPDAT